MNYIEMCVNNKLQIRPNQELLPFRRVTTYLAFSRYLRKVRQVVGESNLGDAL